MIILDCSTIANKAGIRPKFQNTKIKGALYFDLKRILADKRHHTITLLEDGSFEERNFSAWSMGLKNLNSETLKEVPGFFPQDLKLHFLENRELMVIMIWLRH